MKAVLMSIHPKWCEKIFNGEKTIEVRKTAPKLETPFTVYVYQTKHKCEKRDSPLVVDALDEIFGCGKVIGSFVCDEIYSFITWGAGAACIDSGWNQVPPERAIKETCLTEQQIMDYLERGIGSYEGYGWHITELKLLDKPKEISEFRTPFPFSKICLNCELNKNRTKKGFNAEYCSACSCFKDNPSAAIVVLCGGMSVLIAAIMILIITFDRRD